MAVVLSNCRCQPESLAWSESQTLVPAFLYLAVRDIALLCRLRTGAGRYVTPVVTILGFLPVEVSASVSGKDSAPACLALVSK